MRPSSHEIKRPDSYMDSIELAQLMSSTQGTPLGVSGDDLTIRRVCIDSRTLQPGEVFWALRGAQHDGHAFVAEAVRRGAALCVVASDKAEGLQGPLLVVEDTLRALGDFARWYRHQHESLVIGVTGSVGKTTTREMIHAVLSARHSGMSSPRNFNNEVGLPLSLLDMSSSDDFAVLEMGASRAGDIRTLCEIACPEVGVIPKLGVAHLETFGSIEAIFQAKGELLDSLLPHGFAVIGGDDEWTRGLSQRASCPVLLVGEKAGNHVRATEVEFKNRTMRFTVDRKRYEVPTTARHHLTAALCAIAVAREIGMDASGIAAGLLRFVPQPGRCLAEQLCGWTVIDDTYNANPTSMEAACRCLNDWSATGKKLLVAGDMLELGPDSSRYHYELGALIAQQEIDRLLVLGSEAPHVVQGALRAGMPVHHIAEFSELESLLAVLDCWLEPGDAMLVKGSRGMRMERVIEWNKRNHAQYLKEQQARGSIRAVA